ncbi:hypothetical protein GCM10017673_41430 [Streptosporangium violaceochromogenes]|nr:hypothetical protein GCM10017673_41430 [Streptosporangium violaceochromogenes]
MNDTGNAPNPASPPPGSPPFPSSGDRGTLRRGDEGRMLTGVCAGLGRHAGIDPVVFRVGFAVLVLGSGIGVMLYIAAFLLMRESNGGPGYIEQWTRRDFDGETVLALLSGVFALGLVINLSSDGIGTGTVVVGTLFAIALLTAHARGVDLLAVTRSLPDRLRGRRPSSPPPVFSSARGGAPGFSPVPGTPAWSSPAAPPAEPPAAPASPPPAAPVPGEAASGAPAPETPEAPGPLASGTSGTAGPGASPARARPAAEDGPVTGVRAETPIGPPTGPSVGPSAAPPPPPGTPPGRPPLAPTAGPYPVGVGSFDSSGEPFSPYGPYRPLDPRRRQQPYAPYPLPGYGPPVERAPRKERPRSFVGAVTLFLAMIVGGIVVAIQSTSGSVNMTVAGGAMLVTIGAGLLVATWFGRGAGLVAVGTVVALALIAGSTLSGMPKKFGTYHWDPVKPSEVAPSYAVGIGEGTLDLSELPLPPGSRTALEVSVSVGEIRVILPPTARAEVSAYTKLGDVKIDHSVKGGADVRHSKTLEPELPPKGEAATIVLNLRAGIGDIEVRRAA